MSEDKRVTEDLIETLQDGVAGFAKAAERLADSERPELATSMRGFSEQRASFVAELEQLAARYGDEVDEEGSLAAKAHRGWMAVKDAMSGSDPSGVLGAAEQGEDHAVSQYEEALAKDISENLRAVVARQRDAVAEARNEIRALRASAS